VKVPSYDEQFLLFQGVSSYGITLIGAQARGLLNPSSAPLENDIKEIDRFLGNKKLILSFFEQGKTDGDLIWKRDTRRDDFDRDVQEFNSPGFWDELCPAYVQLSTLTKDAQDYAAWVFFAIL